MDSVFTGQHSPDRLQLRDIACVDLIQRAVSPAIVASANHQPVAGFRVLQPLRRYGLIVLEDGSQPLSRWNLRRSLRKTCEDHRGDHRRRGGSNGYDPWTQGHGCLSLRMGAAIIHRVVVTLTELPAGDGSCGDVDRSTRNSVNVTATGSSGAERGV